MKKAGLMIPAFVLLLTLAGSSQAEDLPKGTPVDAVECAADPGQSYALYLPSTYRCDRRWPIIYIFEPGARGPLAIRIFREAAEKYGYVLVCSNNSRNGPWEPIARALRSVWNDTQKRLCIDNDRVYSAGHSGGAQVALMFGSFLGKPWAGVISCCGSLPDLMPAQTLPKDLAVFVATGLYDFNYWPSRKIASSLDAAGVANHLETFADGHTWLPVPAAMDALSWLELRAMKKGLRGRDDGWIAAQFAERLRRAQEIEQAGKSVEAHEAFSALVADFRGLVDVAPAESSAARLDRPAEIKEYGETQQKTEKEESLKFARIIRALGAFMNTADAWERRRCLDELEISSLRKNAQKGDASPAGLAARRMLEFIFSQTIFTAAQANERSDRIAARRMYEVAVLVQPDRGYVWYNLACVHSRLGEIKDALRALETAVKKGVQDREAIEKDADLEALRREPAYIRLMETLKKDPPAINP
jgi:tetratricopeptide (TPR) repeat protein